MCLLQGENELLPGRMTPSGDIGYISDDARLYCVGRTDRQIKRSGHRINLDSIQQVSTWSTYGDILALWCEVASTPLGKSSSSQ